MPDGFEDLRSAALDPALRQAAVPRHLIEHLAAVCVLRHQPGVVAVAEDASGMHREAITRAIRTLVREGFGHK